MEALINCSILPFGNSMTRILYYPILVLMISCSSEGNEKDLAVIQSLIAENERAYNEGNPEAVASTYTIDGNHIAFDSPLITGREQIQKLLTERWASGSFQEVKTTINGIQLLSADVSIADITVKFPKEEAEARGTFVMKRKNGKWLIAAARFLPAEKR